MPGKNDHCRRWLVIVCTKDEQHPLCSGGLSADFYAKGVLGETLPWTEILGGMNTD